MNINIKTTTNVEDEAGFVAEIIIKKLSEGKKVLFFITGGSSVATGVEVAKLLKDQSLGNLTVMMTDERYGPLGHPDSNWYQHIQKGFELPEATIIPILTGEGIEKTTEQFNITLSSELGKDQYKIGLFGVGKDGHTAGNLPGSIAVESKDFASHYDTPAFSRITMTPFAIQKLDEAVVWMQGQEKWGVVKDLIENNIEIMKQPAQILKKIPLLTIFTDYKEDLSH
jgi:6-phosphogluconolactonase/glucosamine-6-phosphate isomerase/deaminase